MTLAQRTRHVDIKKILNPQYVLVISEWQDDHFRAALWSGERSFYRSGAALITAVRRDENFLYFIENRAVLLRLEQAFRDLFSHVGEKLLSDLPDLFVQRDPSLPKLSFGWGEESIETLAARGRSPGLHPLQRDRILVFDVEEHGEVPVLLTEVAMRHPAAQRWVQFYEAHPEGVNGGWALSESGCQKALIAHTEERALEQLIIQLQEVGGKQSPLLQATDEKHRLVYVMHPLEGKQEGSFHDITWGIRVAPAWFIEGEDRVFTLPARQAKTLFAREVDDQWRGALASWFLMQERRWEDRWQERRWSIELDSPSNKMEGISIGASLLAAAKKGRLFMLPEFGYQFADFPEGHRLRPVKIETGIVVEPQWEATERACQSAPHIMLQGYSYNGSCLPGVAHLMTLSNQRILELGGGLLSPWIREVTLKGLPVECFVSEDKRALAAAEILSQGHGCMPLPPGVEVESVSGPPEAALEYSPAEGAVFGRWSYGGTLLPITRSKKRPLRAVLPVGKDKVVVIERDHAAEEEVFEQMKQRSGLKSMQLQKGMQLHEGPPSVELHQQLAAWERRGLTIFNKPPPPDVWDLSQEMLDVELEEQTGWFSFSASIDASSQRIDLVPILQRLAQEAGGYQALQLQPDEYQLHWALPNGTAAGVQLGKVRDVLRWMELFFGLEPPRKLSSSEALAAWLTKESEEALRARWKAPEQLRKIAARLQEQEGEPLPSTAVLQHLRPYQRETIGWAGRLFAVGLGGLLADEMGLGKTIQSIALLAGCTAQQTKHRPHLVLCPLSVVWNWAQELQRFAPHLTVAVIGREESQSRDWTKAAASHVIIAPYSMALADRNQMQSMQFGLCVLDEAHCLRNPGTLLYKAVASLRAESRLALTGTPLQNTPMDLWAIYSLLVPGVLGSRTRFSQLFRRCSPQEQPRLFQQLGRSMAPFTMRRRKSEVDLQLPALEQVTRKIALDPAQADVYESIRASALMEVSDLIQQKGVSSSRIELFAALTRLRQVCCDPRLLDDVTFRDVPSAKLDALDEMVQELLSSGRRLLIFSSFTRLLDRVRERLQGQDIHSLLFTGQTVNRQEVLQKFEEGEAPVLLISLKAGGVGLNLTSADTVILLDPWWNPAMEAQAIGRAHRIGQNHSVTVFRLVTQGTVEERISTLQESKRLMADLTEERGGEEAPVWDTELVTALFSESPTSL